MVFELESAIPTSASVKPIAVASYFGWNFDVLFLISIIILH